MLHITHEFAVRLEMAEALDGADCAEAQCRLDRESGAAVRAVAGGFCTYLGAASPLTHALGIAMHGPITAEQMDEIEEFFRSRDAAVTIDVSPYADPTLLELLADRGYRVHEFSNVLVRVISPGESFEDAPSDIAVRQALSTEQSSWAHASVAGFFGREFLNDDELNLGHVLFAMPSAVNLFALLEGEVAGTAQMTARHGVASCFADSTLVPFRRRGVHSALIYDRLRRAASAGCDLITAGTQPGSGSQRDYERFGFQVAYTKVTMMAD